MVLVWNNNRGNGDPKGAMNIKEAKRMQTAKTKAAKEESKTKK